MIQTMPKPKLGRPRKHGGPIESTSFRIDDAIKARLDKFAAEMRKLMSPGMERHVSRSTVLQDLLSYVFWLQDQGKLDAATVQDALRKPA